jgi:voltage-gated potassium channel
MDPVKQLKFSLLMLALIVLAGTTGYMLIEGWRLLDAFYMTAITLATIGFREVHDLSDSGKMFTVVLIVFGVSFLGYTASKLAQIMFEGQLQRYIGRQKVEKKIESMKDHYIICGYGRIGSLICREFAAEQLPFVVIESHQDVIERLEEGGHPYLRGNATEDETLLKAGIKRAKGLISVVTSDTENVYITLTARGLNPGLYILARSGDPGSEIKLQRAGANKVVSPYQIGGSRMAQAILKPNVVDFIEIATGRGHYDLQMEEIFIPDRSPFAGKNLLDAGFRRETGVIIIGIKKASGQMVFNPDSRSIIEAKDTLIVLGQGSAVAKLENLVSFKAPLFDRGGNGQTSIAT